MNFAHLSTNRNSLLMHSWFSQGFLVFLKQHAECRVKPDRQWILGDIISGFKERKTMTLRFCSGCVTPVISVLFSLVRNGILIIFRFFAHKSCFK